MWPGPCPKTSEDIGGVKEKEDTGGHHTGREMEACGTDDELTEPRRKRGLWDTRTEFWRTIGHGGQRRGLNFVQRTGGRGHRIGGPLEDSRSFKRTKKDQKSVREDK